MNILIKVGQLLMSLSLLIILHELGHFIFARLFKTRVEKFYLFFDFFGFSLFKIKKGDTQYGMGWLPLGGYVKISGMIDESMDREQLKKDPQPYEFRTKPAWQRLLIMLGGVLVNVIMAIVIYIIILFAWGEKYLPNKNITDGVWITDSIMYDIGFRTGDKIISINGTEPGNFSNMLADLLYGGEIVVSRNGKDSTLNLPIDFTGQLIDKSIHDKQMLLLYPRIPFIVLEVPETSHNYNSGLQPKDQIVMLHNIEVNYVDQITNILDSCRNKTLVATVKRGNQHVTLNLKVNENGKLQVAYGLLSFNQLDKLGTYKLDTKEYSIAEAIPAGITTAHSKLKMYLKQFKLIFNFETGAYKGVGGVGAITNLFPPVWHWQSFWEITALLSIMLAFLNILPIPALDGGHVAFLAYEMITGRKPGDKFLEYAQLTGMFLILFLLLYANGNDLYRFIQSLIGK